LKLRNIRCGWYDGCPPLSPWSVELSNAVDADTFDTSMVKVTPELPGLKVDVSGRYLTVRGRSKGRTTYTVSLSSEIKDVFGQTLDQPATGTVKVGEAEPMLFPEQDAMMVLDPAFDPKLSVYSVNRNALKVRLYKVSPKDWDAYLKFRQAWDWDGRITNPPGRLIKTTTVRPKGERDELTETQIDLTAALTDGVGQVIAIVEPPVQPKPRDRWSYREREWVRAWLQVTKLGLTAFKDDEHAYAWVTDLATGSPIGDAEVHVLPLPGGAKTGSDGIAKLPLGPDGDQLTAARGKDLIFVPGSRLSGTFTARTHRDTVRWFVFDDRHLYKPGERVNVKGWVRLQQSGKHGDLGRLSTHGRQVSYTVRDPRGADLAKGTTTLDESDGFHLSFDLPKNANTGTASVRFAVPTSAWGDVYTHSFAIEEFRRPEFEVGAQVSEGPHSVGKHAIATVSASYFAGGGLANADVTWNVTAQDAYFTPPNQSSYHFGKPHRWSWWSSGDADERRAEETWKAKTDADGSHRLRIDFDALSPAFPRKIDLEARITDVNRQSWSARTDLLVHPASITVGLRQESQLLRAGQNAQVNVIVSDLEGALVEGSDVQVHMARVDRTWRGRKVQEKLVDEQTCDVKSAAEAVRCSLPTKDGGLHRIWAMVKDKWGRPSRTEMDFYVLGQDPALNPTVQQDRVDILPDKKEYAGGETAKLLVMAPFAPAEGVLTLRRDGVVQLTRFHIDKRTTTLDVKLDPAWLPNVYARVDLVGQRVREGENGEPDSSLPKRPAAASGEAELEIPPTERTLDIDVKPKLKALSPGGSTSISVDVTHESKPVAGAAVALVVVDESVLALAGYDLPNPIAALYPKRSDGVSDFEMRLRIALMRPDTARFEMKAKRKDSAPGAKKEMLNGYGAGKSGAVMRATAKPAPMPSAAPSPKVPMAETAADKKSG
ncbi:MAG: hypothetical protein KC776_07215, partial [Myxococcales bacterium]|nr:hypothetical protein [Myxococcales bacterium]